MPSDTELLWRCVRNAQATASGAYPEMVIDSLYNASVIRLCDTAMDAQVTAAMIELYLAVSYGMMRAASLLPDAFAPDTAQEYLGRTTTLMNNAQNVTFEIVGIFHAVVAQVELLADASSAVKSLHQARSTLWHLGQPINAILQLMLAWSELKLQRRSATNALPDLQAALSFLDGPRRKPVPAVRPFVVAGMFWHSYCAAQVGNLHLSDQQAGRMHKLAQGMILPDGTPAEVATSMLFDVPDCSRRVKVAFQWREQFMPPLLTLRGLLPLPPSEAPE